MLPVTNTHSKMGHRMAVLEMALYNPLNCYRALKRVRLGSLACRDGQTGVETLLIYSLDVGNGSEIQTKWHQRSDREPTVGGILHVEQFLRWLPGGSFVVACTCSLDGRSCAGA